MTDHAAAIRKALEWPPSTVSARHPKTRKDALAAVDALVAERDRLKEALGRIADGIYSNPREDAEKIARAALESPDD